MFARKHTFSLRAFAIVILGLAFSCVLAFGQNPNLRPVQKLPPLQLPTDGEPAPALPDIPGVIIPEIPIQEPSNLPKWKIPELLEDADLPTEFATWVHNPRDGGAKAKAEGKYLFLAFVGTSWANTGAALNSEVLTTKPFHDLARKHLVLTFIDFPQNRNHYTESQKAYRKKFNVKGFPTVVLFDPDGNVLRQISGFRQNRGEGYLSKVKDAVEQDVWARAEKAKARVKLEKEDGFRTWRSAKGGTLFAKLVAANGRFALFRDEDGDKRKVALRQLNIADREIVRRRKTGKK